jgi:hypothetical protein
MVKNTGSLSLKLIPLLIISCLFCLILTVKPFIHEDNLADLCIESYTRSVNNIFRQITLKF